MTYAQPPLCCYISLEHDCFNQDAFLSMLIPVVLALSLGWYNHCMLGWTLIFDTSVLTLLQVACKIQYSTIGFAGIDYSEI